MANIRAYRPGDGAALADLYRRSVEAIGPRDYSARQVAAWAGLCPSAEAFGVMCAAVGVALVAVDAADRPVAFADLEPDGHIRFLYAAPEAAGTGVVSALFDALEREARARGLARLHAEASEAARRFFLKKGFTVTARRDFAVAGVPIHNYAVEKALMPAAFDPDRPGSKASAARAAEAPVGADTNGHSL